MEKRLEDALAEAIRAAYSDRLDEEQLRAVCERLGRNLEMAATLRKHSLKNGDEPDFTFAAYRREG